MIAKTLTESRTIQAQAQIDPAALLTGRERADLAYEAGLQGRDFPCDWTFRGHLARAYWEGVAERERRWGLLRDSLHCSGGARSRP